MSSINKCSAKSGDFAERGVISTNYKTKIQATILGVGLGFFASFKTIIHLANPYSGGLGTILLWDSVANKGVNNYPSSK